MNTELEKIWQDAQGHLSRELKGPIFQTWIKPTKLISLTENVACVAVKNEFNKNILRQTYFEKINSCLEQVLKKKIVLEIIVKADLDIKEFVSSIANLSEQKQSAFSNSAGGETSPFQGGQHSVLNNEGYFDHTFRYRSNLNPIYTFESFVVGPSNQFCHAACLAVAEATISEYNPLFIYGGVGLGKTHLAHAVANFAADQNKNLNVKYLSSESFTNELISSIRTDGMNKFRQKYRQVDLLMIDDVQFLAGKEATQEEFFHTFNTLKENGKQIILTSDRPPTSLASMTDRLKNRFEGGLIADIQIPDLETRIAILTLKASQLGIELNSDIAYYIAAMYSSNIRELEGALKKVHAYLAFTRQDINLNNVKKVLSCNPDFSKPSPDSVIKTVASFYHISFEDLISSKRSSDLTLPRHVAIYLLHDSYKLSFPRIGELFSDRTHSSAIYACKQVKKKLALDPKFSEQVSSIRGILERRRQFK